MSWFSKTSAAVQIAAAIAGGGGAEKSRDNYNKGRAKEQKAQVERTMSRRNETYSSIKK